MKTFSLKVLAADHVFYDGRCQMAVLPAQDGELGVLANHEDILAALNPGKLRIQKEDGCWETVRIGKGIMQNVNHRMVILTESAEQFPELAKASDEV